MQSSELKNNFIWSTWWHHTKLQWNESELSLLCQCQVKSQVALHEIGHPYRGLNNVSITFTRKKEESLHVHLPVGKLWLNSLACSRYHQYTTEGEIASPFCYWKHSWKWYHHGVDDLPLAMCIVITNLLPLFHFHLQTQSVLLLTKGFAMWKWFVNSQIMVGCFLIYHAPYYISLNNPNCVCATFLFFRWNLLSGTVNALWNCQWLNCKNTWIDASSVATASAAGNSPLHSLCYHCCHLLEWALCHHLSFSSSLSLFCFLYFICNGSCWISSLMFLHSGL